MQGRSKVAVTLQSVKASKYGHLWAVNSQFLHAQIPAMLASAHPRNIHSFNHVACHHSAQHSVHTLTGTDSACVSALQQTLQVGAPSKHKQKPRIGVCSRAPGHALLQKANKTVSTSMGSIFVRKLATHIASFVLPHALLSRSPAGSLSSCSCNSATAL